MNIVVAALAVVVVAIGVASVVAARRWRATTAHFIVRLTNDISSLGPTVFRPSDLEGLPEPVARYLGTVLRVGQPLIREARLSQHGEFLLRPTPKGWRPFRAQEMFTSSPAGFVWDARIRMAPGLTVFVRDAFVGNVGFMRGSVLGLVPVLDVHGTPEITAGALHRYLAESVWFPTALLPSQGVTWTAVDHSTARATLRQGRTTVSLDFRFDSDGLVTSVYTPERSRDVNGHSVPTPWLGHFWRYETRAGVMIPVEGEAEWLLPEGPQPYWRGHIDEVSFVYAQPYVT